MSTSCHTPCSTMNSTATPMQHNELRSLKINAILIAILQNCNATALFCINVFASTSEVLAFGTDICSVAEIFLAVFLVALTVCWGLFVAALKSRYLVCCQEGAGQSCMQGLLSRRHRAELHACRVHSLHLYCNCNWKNNERANVRCKLILNWAVTLAIDPSVMVFNSSSVTLATHLSCS